jgi:hypothetical protein
MKGANRKLTGREKAASSALRDLDLVLVPYQTLSGQTAAYGLLSISEHTSQYDARMFGSIEAVEQFIAGQKTLAVCQDAS